MTPELVGRFVNGPPNAIWTVFEQSAHMAHVEESDAYLRVLAEHRQRCEQAAH
jgi:hypothetical protein